MMNNLSSKKISIIMPVYNTEQYLSTAIDSVFNKNMDGIELIIINDGSTDNSDNIIKEKIGIYNEIIYIK